jgi:hypothetical protein
MNVFSPVHWFILLLVFFNDLVYWTKECLDCHVLDSPSTMGCRKNYIFSNFMDLFAFVILEGISHDTRRFLQEYLYTLSV